MTGSSTWQPGHAPGAGEQITPEVRLVRPLGRGGMGSVWAGYHSALGVEVAVKFVTEHTDPTLDRRLAREAELATRVEHPHAVKVLDHGKTAQGTPFIVMELIEGESLRERILRLRRLPLAELGAVVGQVAGALDAAHALGIVHRDVKPANVLLLDDGDDIRAKLIFGVARPVDPAATTLTRVGQILGTPVYMAPEQLIEVQAATHHADLWALAVLAYEAATGQRPFDGPTLAGVVVALMMRTFEPVTALDLGLPEALDGFFARAFHADPRQRYQTAGELADALLAACSAPDGSVRVHGRMRRPIRLPDRVYGREAELDRLKRAFDDAAAGAGRTVTLSGYAGTGKTALVHELRRRLRRTPVTVVSNKFDAYDRGRPYQSLLDAFRLLDTEALGELEVEEGTEATPAQRARFQVAMARIVRELATAEMPLVLFCDDLQWADPASLDLIGALATDPELRHVLLVCAYRDNEVRGTHLLLPALDRIRASGRLEELALRPLHVEAVLDLIGDAFPGLPARMRLASAAHGKTRGNAFFLRRFLERLGEQDLLREDTDSGRWTWDADGVEALEMPDDVVAFVSAELGGMAAASRHALSVAACIGDTFEVEALAHVLGCDRAATLERLRPALATQLVGADRDGSTHGRRVVLRFAHDRVRQAARAELGPDEAADVHHRVGRFLLDHLPSLELESRLFEVVEHLNRGGGASRSDAERSQLRALNLDAARRAIRSAAFEVGDRYLRHARALVEPDGWTRDYSQTLAIHLEGARAAYLAGGHAEMEQLVDLAAQQARGELDRLAAWEVRVQARLSQQRFLEALELALAALAALGTSIPAKPTRADAEAAVGQAMAALSAHTNDDLRRLPISTDPVVHARQRLATSAMSSAYMAAPTLLPILACTIVRSTLDEGASRDAPYGFAALALVLVAAGQIEAGYATGRIASELLDRMGDRSNRARTLHVLAAHVMLHVEPIRTWLEVERQVARLGLDAGDLEYAAWGLHAEVCNGFYAGLPLAELSETYERNRAALEHHQQLAALGCTLQYGRVIAALTGGPEPDYDEEAQLAGFRATNFRGAAFILSVTGAYLRFLSGRFDEASALADAGAEFADGAPATWHLVWWAQVRALSVLGAVDPSDPDAVQAALEDVAPQVEQLRAWGRSSEVNHAHRVDLVEGEIARLEGRTAEAIEHLRRAAEHAAAQGFQHEEALAFELAARCHRRAGDAEQARALAARARDVYLRWGATAKADQLFL